MPRHDPDDVFADSRMSFGEHIEELRAHLLRAIIGLIAAVAICGGADGVGNILGNPKIGVGRPMLAIITAPVNEMSSDFFARRNRIGFEKFDDAKGVEPLSDDAARRLLDRLDSPDASLRDFSSQERSQLMLLRRKMTLGIPIGPLAEALGLKPPTDPDKTVEVPVMVSPVEMHLMANQGETLLGLKSYVSTLSVTEAMITYFKVLLLCSAVLASPWILYQLWSFIAAGLYPSERAVVYRMFWPSVTLFIAGVLMCQFMVLPGAVNALIGFNEWLGLEPDIRLNEWLSLALTLPLVFGISFQTPLVMVLLNRLGTFSWQDYWARWRGAAMTLAVFAAVITPTPDMVTMMYLFVPMYSLYLLGIAICKYFPPPHEGVAIDDNAAQVAV